MSLSCRRSVPRQRGSMRPSGQVAGTRFRTTPFDYHPSVSARDNNYKQKNRRESFSRRGRGGSSSWKGPFINHDSRATPNHLPPPSVHPPIRRRASCLAPRDRPPFLHLPASSRPVFSLVFWFRTQNHHHSAIHHPPAAQPSLRFRFSHPRPSSPRPSSWVPPIVP